jgi:hypothetical protein
LLAIMVTGGYLLVYRIAKLFEKKSDWVQIFLIIIEFHQRP